jgi:hypothetical protein
MMSLVDSSSCICVKSELDLFGVPPTQTSIENSSMTEYRPIAALTDGGPIEFTVPGTSSDYIDPAHVYLYVECRLTRDNGENINDDDSVAPVNLLLHSLFQQLDVALNGTLVSSSTNTYAYRAYLETLMNYGKGAKETQLTSSLWYKDVTKMDDTITTDAGVNFGLVKRAMMTSNGKTVDMIGRLHCDLFHQEKLLLDQVGMHIKLTRSSSKFVLMTADEGVKYAVKIEKAKLYVRKVTVLNAVTLAHAKALEHVNAKYPLQRVVCKTFTIPAQTQNHSQESVFTGQLPTRLVIGFVDNDAFNGNYKKNPFNFKHFDISSVAIQVDGQEKSVKPIECNFERGQIAKAYMNLFWGARKAFKDEDIEVNRDDYANGYTLFCFDLTPDLGETVEHFNLIKTGNVRLEVFFNKPVPATINVIVYGEFQNVLEIDRNRNIFYDFTT